MSRAYDRFMVHVDLGTEEKLAGLTEGERLCHIVGVLAIAAKSPIRGLLIVGESEATAAHVAKRADVSRKTADSTLAKLKDVGILVRDDENGAWAVHSWGTFNPAPKHDTTGAARQARYRERLLSQAGDAVTNAVTNAVTDRHVTPPVTAVLRGEVEGKGSNNNPLTPAEAGGPLQMPVRPSGNRGRDMAAYQKDVALFAADRFPSMPEPQRTQMVSAGLGRGIDDEQKLREFVMRWAPVEESA